MNVHDADADTQDALRRLIAGYTIPAGIYVAAKLGIADLLAGGPKSSQELAEAADVHAPTLYRVLRMLASAGVFVERDDGRFALTPLAALLRSGVPCSLREQALLLGTPEHFRAWGELLYCVQTGQPAFHHIYGKGDMEDPETSAPMHALLTARTVQEEAPAILAAYDFSGIGTIVDVGGGQGAFIGAVLNAYPAMRGTLFDLPHVVAGAGEVLASYGVGDRCALVAGEFFQAVPAGGDAYVLKKVIHDWDDERGFRILKRCREVMEAGSKLLLMEAIMPSTHPSFWLARTDVQMLVMAGGKERTAEEYAALLGQSGFRLERIVPTGTGLSVIEGLPV